MDVEMEDWSEYGVPSAEWLKLVQSGGTAAPQAAPGHQTAEGLQRATNAAREAASAQAIKSLGLLNVVEWTDHDVPTRDGQTIAARVYRHKWNPITKDAALSPVYVFFHGGGFLFGTLNTEDANCARIVEALPELILVHVCYRHTPHYRHPTQANDAWDSFEWIQNHMDMLGGDPNRLIVGGVSAGGSLAASVVLRHNQMRPPKLPSVLGQMLCIPWLNHTSNWSDRIAAGVGSYVQNADAPILPRRQVDMFTRELQAEDACDLSIFPGNAKDKDLVGMPRTVILVAGMDPLRDEALLYGKRLRAHWVPCEIHVFAGLPHGFYRYTALPSTDVWFKRITDGLRTMLHFNT